MASHWARGARQRERLNGGRAQRWAAQPGESATELSSIALIVLLKEAARRLVPVEARVVMPSKTRGKSWVSDGKSGYDQMCAQSADVPLVGGRLSRWVAKRTSYRL